MIDVLRLVALGWQYQHGNLELCRQSEHCRFSHRSTRKSLESSNFQDCQNFSGFWCNACRWQWSVPVIHSVSPSQGRHQPLASWIHNSCKWLQFFISVSYLISSPGYNTMILLSVCLTLLVYVDHWWFIVELPKNCVANNNECGNDMR